MTPNSKQPPGASGTGSRCGLLAAALAAFALLVVPVAIAGPANGSGDPRATAAASLPKQVKKLKKQVKKLKQKVSEVEKQQGPPGPQGEKGEKGDKGDPGEPGLTTGPAGGDLAGNYPDPSIAGGAVTTQKLGNLAVTNPKLANNAVNSAKVADDSLGAADIASGAVASPEVLNDSLSFVDIGPSAVMQSELANSAVNSSKVLDNSLTGTDINESTLSVPGLGCQSGKILGFARVKGEANIPTTYSSSSSFIDFANNCAGGAVQVRKDPFGATTVPGRYFVRFLNNPAAIALATPNTDGLGTDSGGVDNIISVAKVTSGPDAGAFRVEVQDVDQNASGGTGAQNGAFTILLP